MSITQSCTIGVSTGVVFLQVCGIILYRIYTMCHQFTQRNGREATEMEVDILQENAILEIDFCHPKLPLPAAERQPLLANMQDDQDNST